MSKLVMLDVESTILLTYEILKEYRRRGESLETNITDSNFYKPSIKQAVDIVALVVKSLVDSRSMFPSVLDIVTKESNLTKQMKDLIFYDKVKTPSKASEKAVNVFIDKFFKKLSNELEFQIFNLVKVNNYYLWHIVRCGRNISILQGEDHRIYEYHRLTDTLDVSQTFNFNINPVIEFLNNEYNVSRIVPEDVFNIIAQKLFVDELLVCFPNVELIDYCLEPRILNNINNIIVNLDPNFAHSIHITIKQILDNYKSHLLDKWLSSEVQYTLEVKPHTLSFVSTEEYDKSTEGDVYKNGLVLSLLNGDYLPQEERLIAEEHYRSNPEYYLY